MSLLHALPKLSLASHGQHLCRPLSMESKPRRMGPFEAHVLFFFCLPPKQPQPHPSQSQFILCQSLPHLVAFVSPLPSAWIVQLLPRLEGSAPKPPVCCLPTLTPAEFPIPLLSVGQTLVPLVVSFQGPQITAGCSHVRLPHWAAGSQEQGLNSAICLELCFVHSRGSINIYWVNQSALQQGPSQSVTSNFHCVLYLKVSFIIIEGYNER